MKILLKITVLLIPIIFIFMFFFLLTEKKPYPGADYKEFPIPNFNLESLYESEPLTNVDLRGDYIINIWASWCIECVREHRVLNIIKNDKKVKLIGINYKDDYKDAIGWLKIYGNPYEYNIVDKDGQLGIDLGVYGVPETFLIDENKIIRAKYIGAISEDIYYNEILPTIKNIGNDY